ncbi:MAG: hypothetical protein AAF298_21040 [Cyanobacteria bacterium P01_A01_bin.40]
MEKVNKSHLTNPEQGRVYLKAAIEQEDEQVFLQALHNIIDSLVDSELALSCVSNKMSLEESYTPA